MKTLRYLGPGDVRSISDAEAEKLGLSAHGFSVARNETIEVTNALGTYLLEQSPKSWRIVSETEEDAIDLPDEVSSTAEPVSDGKQTEAAPVDVPTTATMDETFKKPK